MLKEIFFVRLVVMVSQITLDKKLQDTLTTAVNSLKADYAEIRAEESVSTRILFKGVTPEIIAEPKSLGFFVRVLINGSWGIATFTDISKLKQKLTQAVDFAKSQGKGNVILADELVYQAEVSFPMQKDFSQISLNKKVALVKHYNDLALKTNKKVQTTSTNYGDTSLTKFFVNSRGARILQTRPYVRLTVQAMGRKDNVIEMYRDAVGHVGGYEIVEDLDQKMIEVNKQAVELTTYPKVKSGTYTAILDPYMAGTFAHEAFGHFSEADHQYENPNILEQMAIGRKLGSAKVNIVDDPSINNGWGNFLFDDEGVLAKKANLLTEGIITERLHSLETAGKLKEKANGRARADGYTNRPIPRMSNTFFVPGQDKLADLISSTKNGILVINWFAGMTAMENFTFTALYGVMIRNGKLAEKVRGVKLMGNVFETLKNIDGVSDDFAVDTGTCGKEGQSMQVGSGGAYIRINNVTIGGD